MLTDPDDALAEQSGVLHALLGLAGVSRLVHQLADGPQRTVGQAVPDDVVYVLLGMAGLGDAVHRLAAGHDGGEVPGPPDGRPAATHDRWLR